MNFATLQRPALLFFILCFSLSCVHADPTADPTASPDAAPHGDPILDPVTPAQITFGFWNLENLFDADDDPNNRGDDEFLPANEWTAERYQRKLDHLAEIIGEMKPHILGVCEVENERVLNDLVKRPAVAALGYKVVHEDSPDKRGIDLGLLYRAPVSFVKDSKKTHIIPIDAPTRGVFECRLEVAGHPLAVLVNHWPSRGGGLAKTRPLRAQAGKVCLQAVKSIRASQKGPAGQDADILILGDLNDDPFDESVRVALGAVRSRNAALNRNKGNHLYNASWSLLSKTDEGTLYYNREWVWNVFDQCIVSKGLIQEGNLWYEEGSLTIYGPLKMRDKYRRPVRFRKDRRNKSWTEGYSDHLPILGTLRYLEPSKS